jgi:hypothetical protein
MKYLNHFVLFKDVQVRSRGCVPASLLALAHHPIASNLRGNDTIPLIFQLVHSGSIGS